MFPLNDVLVFDRKHGHLTVQLRSQGREILLYLWGIAGKKLCTGINNTQMCRVVAGPTLARVQPVLVPGHLVMPSAVMYHQRHFQTPAECRVLCFR